jgi:hypothetical protein
MVEPSGDRGIEIGDLIAAAPDTLRQRDELLEALEMAVSVLRDVDADTMMAGEFEILTDAIASAKGVQS